MPYKKISVNTAVATVTMMNVFELRNLSSTGGLVAEPVNQVNMLRAEPKHVKKENQGGCQGMVLIIY